MAVARAWLDNHRHNDTFTIRRWRGSWMVWDRSKWVERDQAAISADLWLWLEDANYLDRSEDPPKVKAWHPSRRRIGEVSAAAEAITFLPEDVNPPSWLTASGGESPVFVSVANGLLDVTTRTLRPHDPRFFNLAAVPFAYEPDTPPPGRWLKFLADLWPGDQDSVHALQEYFGYVLSGRTDLHKILLIVGPPRGGKGTIARILTALVGKTNMAGPTLASLNTQFGLAPLLGKPLAIISDARLAGRDSHQVVERLLMLSGEDTLTIDRKNRDAWTGQLPTRLVILSNELPTFGDSSGAIATRFITLVLANSWLGKEDINLGQDLNRELPGILNWALDGLDRVNRRDRITEPASSVEAVTAMADAASPTGAFLREMCETGPGHEVLVDDLWTAWKTWCEDNGRPAGSKQTLGRNLRAVLPGIQVARPRQGCERKRTFYGVALLTADRSTGGPRSLSSQSPENYQVNTATGPLGPHGPHRFQSSVGTTSSASTSEPESLSAISRTIADHVDRVSYELPQRGPQSVQAARTDADRAADQASVLSTLVARYSSEGGHHWWLAQNRPEHPGCAACAAKKPGGIP